MSAFSSKDFNAASTTRIRNAIAGITGVSAPATVQQCSDYVTKVLQRDTKDWERLQQIAAINPADPD